MSVVSVSLSPTHEFSKPCVPSITLIAGHGVQGDCHYGTTVQHRSRLHIRPSPLNLRQVHIMHEEMLEKAHDMDINGSGGFRNENKQIKPGDLGENVTTRGFDVLSLGEGTRLHFVDGQIAAEIAQDKRRLRDLYAGQDHAVVAVRGLRNPCPQIDKFRAGLKERFVERDEKGDIVERLAGVMCTVEVGGEVRPGMAIVIEAPEVYRKLDCV